MTLVETYGAATVRKARASAKRAGHDMGTLIGGFDGPEASCRRKGCQWLLVLRGRDDWRLVWSGPFFPPRGGRCVGLATAQPLGGP